MAAQKKKQKKNGESVKIWSDTMRTIEEVSAKTRWTKRIVVDEAVKLLKKSYE